MGIYFNPNNGSFTKDTNSKIYIDKSGLLEELNQVLNTKDCYIAVSHARRFGKSQAAGMIDAYYSLGSDSHELFEHLEIANYEDYEKHLNKYNVVHLDISTFLDCYEDNLVDKIVEYLYDEFKTVYEKVDYGKNISSVISQICSISRKLFVIIIDEWDCVIRNLSNRQDIVHKYLQFLHMLFKSEESKQYIALAYITGILPIKKIKDESALNNFTEYTMVNSKNLTKYYGFTENEVQCLCEKYEMDFESTKEWYDGYFINGLHMYNPNSVYNAMVYHSLESYWKNTSAFSTINTYVLMGYAGLKDDVIHMLEGERVEVNVNTFKNDLSEINSKDDVLTALIHLGYLAYDNNRNEAYIPNHEVSLAFQAALSDNDWGMIANTISKCDSLLRALDSKM